MTGLGELTNFILLLQYFCYSLLMWLMPVLVVLFAALEYIMFLLYNQYGHPWKEILKAALEVENKILNIAPNNYKAQLVSPPQSFKGFRFKDIIHHLN